MQNSNTGTTTKIEKFSKQKIAKVIGENGCYFLSICYIAELLLNVYVDPIYYFAIFSKKLCNGLPWIEDDCYMNFPDLVLETILKNEIAKHGISFKFERIKITKSEDLFYFPKINEHLIGYYENKTTMKTYGHFVNIDCNKKVINDPLGESNTVKNGKLKSLRVIEIV